MFTSVLIGMMLNENSINERGKKFCDFIEKCILESSNYDYQIREGFLLEVMLNELHNVCKVKKS